MQALLWLDLYPVQEIIPDLCIIQSRDGEHGPRDQFCLKAADGGDIQGVYIISPVQGIKNIRKLPGEIASRAIAGHDLIGADELGPLILALDVQDCIGIDEDSLVSAADCYAFSGMLF